MWNQTARFGSKEPFLHALGQNCQCQKTLGNAKNLIGEVMQNFKAIAQESSSGDSFIFENATEMI